VVVAAQVRPLVREDGPQLPWLERGQRASGDDDEWMPAGQAVDGRRILAEDDRA
jgi:hypothetical protein